MESFVSFPRLRRSLLCGLIAILLGTSAQAQNAQSESVLRTNQNYVEDVLRRSSLDIGNLEAVFAWVFQQLPDKVHVFPTENYYYFGFTHNGVQYAGNFRLDTADRDKGIVYFAYFEKFTGWRRDEITQFKPFSASDGVEVKKVSTLVYRITFKGKSVIFELNDLRNVKPPANRITRDETYIGPVFDESGLGFYLLYNSRLKIFHYVLNEQKPVADQLYPSKISKNILMGRRTGFAFYKDKNLDRKILIGVYKPNANVNNYLDGPFDQLPDNFIKGDTLKKAILEVAPEHKGKIDRFGIAPGGDERYLIAPYLYYEYEEDLAIFDECATDKTIPASEYYACFVIDQDEDGAEGHDDGVDGTGVPEGGDDPAGKTR